MYILCILDQSAIPPSRWWSQCHDGTLYAALTGWKSTCNFLVFQEFSGSKQEIDNIYIYMYIYIYIYIYTCIYIYIYTCMYVCMYLICRTYLEFPMGWLPAIRTTWLNCVCLTFGAVDLNTPQFWTASHWRSWWVNHCNCSVAQHWRLRGDRNIHSVYICYMVFIFMHIWYTLYVSAYICIYLQHVWRLKSSPRETVPVLRSDGCFWRPRRRCDQRGWTLW